MSARNALAPRFSSRRVVPGIVSAPARQQSCGTRVEQQPLQAPGFRGGDGASKPREPIVAPPLVVVFGVGPLGELLDQSLFEEPANGCIEARSEERRVGKECSTRGSRS